MHLCVSFEVTKAVGVAEAEMVLVQLERLREGVLDERVLVRLSLDERALPRNQSA